jgi:hypothetical protein
VTRGKHQARWEEDVAEDRESKETAVTNEISDETGQYDARFLLWRKFCADSGIPVETLPSQLTGEQRERWEKLKEKRLK